MRVKKMILVFIGVIVLAALTLSVNLIFKQADLKQDDKAAPAPILETAVGVNQEQALFKVKALPEVVKYEAELGKAGKKASFETQDDDDGWFIQVFEIVKNDGNSSHTATFGWYKVNKKTGEINRDL